MWCGITKTCYAFFFARFLARFFFPAEADLGWVADFTFFFFADLVLVVVGDFLGGAFFFLFLDDGEVELAGPVIALVVAPLNLERMVSTALLIGLLPFAEELPTSTPVTPPATAPTGPATMPPQDRSGNSSGSLL